MRKRKVNISFPIDVGEHADWVTAAAHAKMKLAEFVRVSVREKIGRLALEEVKNKSPLEDL